MPITKRQFDLGIDAVGNDYMVRIYELLASDSELAFSESELHDEIFDASWTTQQSAQFEAAIRALLRVEAIESREVGRITYYAFRREMDTENWELKLFEI